MVKTLLDKIEENIKLLRGKNLTYSDESLFISMIWAGINRVSIEEATGQLEELGYNVPSSDTILYHLSNQPYKILEEGFQSVIGSLIENARYLFRKSVVLAIDFNLLEWYGEDLPFIIKSKPRKGTDKFIGFATVAIVEDGKRFTLKVLPVTPLSNKKEIVRKLLLHAIKFVRIRVVLMDRGFYSGEIMQMLNNWIRFIIPAVNNDKVKRYKEMAKEKGEIEYEMNNGTEYRMVVHDDGKNIHPFATNTSLSPETIHELYKKRFGIETQYRIKNKFLGRTCSREYSVRYFFFLLAICIYNLWVLLNIIERGKEGLEPGKIPIKVDRLIHLIRKVIFFNSPLR
ncbi:MAG: transposase [Acidobacteriota bacterium]|nr:transposase [Acidobacteriota bacterium]